MLRDIIKIDEEKCNGCGLCIPGCPEGAIQLIDGKARLVSDLSCDGLGACLGHCPEGAIEIEKREAEPYNERAVMENIVKGGKNVIIAHLKHLKDHGETEFYNQALEYLKENNMENPMAGIKPVLQAHGGGCPGSRMMQFNSPDETPDNTNTDNTESRASALTQWPVQLHLLSPRAPFLVNSDLLLSADCVAHAAGDFHKDYLKGKSLAIACPKLDSGLDSYVEKLTGMIDEAKINTLTIMVMEVPCCGGLVAMARKAIENAKRKIPLKKIMISIQGAVLSEEWI